MASVRWIKSMMKALLVSLTIALGAMIAAENEGREARREDAGGDYFNDGWELDGNASTAGEPQGSNGEGWEAVSDGVGVTLGAT